MILFLLKYIRKIILAAALLATVLVYLWATTTIHSDSLLKIRLTQYYALLCVFFLYLSLLISPLYQAFPSLPYKPVVVKARQALGITAWIFAVLHASFGFFGLLGGINGLNFLSREYLNAVIFGSITLSVLTILAATSMHIMVEKLGKHWKKIHRLVYIAGITTLIHACIIGTHFKSLANTIPQILFSAVVFLLVLESARFEKYLRTKYNIPKYAITSTLSLALCFAVYAFFTDPRVYENILSIHADHKATHTTASNTGHMMNMKVPLTPENRFRINTIYPFTIEPNKEIEIKFNIFDQINNQNVTLFSTPFEKPMHMIVVDDTLEYFEHIHPIQQAENFTITKSFPKAAVYTVYLDFQPVGFSEQVKSFSLYVGDVTESLSSQQPVDSDTTKHQDGYAINLDMSQPLSAKKIIAGQQTFKFTITNDQTQQPITDLQPYLASFGHLVMINQKDYQYIHVHPTKTASTTNETIGPLIEFLPMNTTNQIKTGDYRLFMQFKHQEKIITTNYTIHIQP